ncbi:DMT family transporter [Amorphus coralli]|uniref:DMT family transporter n=1 Tax=Amorphus coralli TaxID=340680 RepID=UPI0003608D09|nr:DMT family transporter [Amorphus coralli]
MTAIRLFLITALVMTAFAANSVLNRLALADGVIGPGAFAAIRLGSGPLALCLLVLLTRRRPHWLRPGRILPVVALAAYVGGFSFAYVAMDAGLGALILFGVVQMTMFAGAFQARESIPARKWTGAVLAFAGLVWLLWPAGAGAPPLGAALLMVAAGIGWGAYSLIGRSAADPLSETAVNFALATPLGLALWLLPAGAEIVTAPGVRLAVVSGVVTSGLGYALWYSILPRLSASAAAIAQLTVPPIAMAGGVAVLAEPLTWRFALASVLVLGGVLYSSLGRAVPRRTR